MKDNLAKRMRPETIEDFFGQNHIVDKDRIISSLITKEKMVNLILYGPPGCGKTTLAMILANTFKMNYQLINATIHQKKDIENAISYLMQYQGGLLIIDEIHRMNRDKQEILLSYIENSDVTLIGLTSTNPYFQIIQPLRSRAHLIELLPLDNETIYHALVYATSAEKGLNNLYEFDNEVLETIADYSNGDLRSAYNQLELIAFTSSSYHITIDDLQNTSLKSSVFYDSNSIHYFLSGLQKSIRGSDADAALYYLARLIEANNFDEIERRLLVIAYEDIGLANPALCSQVVSAVEASRKVGFPEARICLSVVVIDLALSPKSTSAYNALDKALAIKNVQNSKLPPFIKADHPEIHAYEQIPYTYKHHLDYLPGNLEDRFFYEANSNSNHEQKLKSNIEFIRNLKRYNLASKLLNKIKFKK